MEFYKIIGTDGHTNLVNLHRIIVVDFYEEEYLIVFDEILNIKVSPQDYRWVRKDLLDKLWNTT